MTSRKRIKSALRHQEPDRTPFFEYVLLSPLADEFLGRIYAGDPANWEIIVQKKGWEMGVRQSAIDQLDLACLLGFDMMYVIPNQPPFKPETYIKPLTDNSHNNPVETILKRNEKILENFCELSNDYFFVYIFLKNEMQRRGIDLPILAPAYEHGVWTDIDLMQTMVLEPEVAHEHFALATKRAMTYIDTYISLGVDQIGIGGDFAGNRPLISPEAYRKFIMPEVRKLSHYLHSKGCWAINASDGNLWSVIDDFLIGCEVDGYLEIDYFAGMDLRRLKTLYGDRITFYGNLDCGNILSFGTPEEVKKHTIECLEAGSGNGGHILCASNAITSSVPLANYLAVIEAYRDMFGIPKLCLNL